MKLLVVYFIMAYSSPPYVPEASSMRSPSGVRPLCDSQYREAAIRAVNQAKKQLANSSLEAELARLDHQYKLKQIKLHESYLAAKTCQNISMVASTATPQVLYQLYSLRVLGRFLIVYLDIPRHLMPLLLSLRCLTVCLLHHTILCPHHIRNLVSLFCHLILHNRVILYMVTHRCTIHPVLQHFQAFPAFHQLLVCLRTVSIRLSVIRQFILMPPCHKDTQSLSFHFNSICPIQ